MIEIVLVRHGQTNMNIKGTYSGWSDSELNETGIEQACIAREKLAGEDFDIIYSSPLKRALRTAEIINENFKKEIILDKNLREHSFGNWEDLTYLEIGEKYPEEAVKWQEDPINHCISGGESTAQFYNRVAKFFDNLIENGQGNRYLIAAHLGTIMIAISHFIGLGVEGMYRFKIDNCGITKITINDEGYAYLTHMNI